MSALTVEQAAAPPAMARTPSGEGRGLLYFHGRIDWLLFCAVLLLVGFGLVVIYSASSVTAEMRYHKGNEHFLVRQGVAAVVSLLVMFWLAMWDYRKLQSPNWAFGSLGVVLIGLVTVHFVDSERHRWFSLPFAQIQPSEFARPAMALFLAWFVAAHAPRINEWRNLARVALVLAVLAGVVIHADVGTAVLLAGLTGAVLYVAGMKRRYLAAAMLALVVLVSAAIVQKPYRATRVLVHLGPKRVLSTIAQVDSSGKLLRAIDPKGTLQKAAALEGTPLDPAYQVNQSLIAVGTGGVFGAGLMQGRQKLLYLPEGHTDFIFAMICEELGLVMGVLVVAGYLVILYRGYRLFWTAADDFGRYLALGITTVLVMQAFINISVVLGLTPTKGITLPLISYGGSSLLCTLMMLGLLLSISERAQGNR